MNTCFQVSRLMSIQASRDARCDGTLFLLEARNVINPLVYRRLQRAYILELALFSTSASDADNRVVDCAVARSVNAVFQLASDTPLFVRDSICL
jgi:hypothetical protein